MRSCRTPRIAATAAVAALVAVQAALAEAPKSQFTATDQAAARAVVLKASDLGAGWTGSVKKGKVDSPEPCPGWNPKQADLVITGVAESEFSAQGAYLHSSAQVYKSIRMAALDWQRTVVEIPMRCLTKEFTAGAGKDVRVVSVRRVSFPKLAKYTARVRVVADFNGDSNARVVVDAVVLGRGRTLATFGLIAPYSQRADADAAEVRLAKILVARIKT